MSNLFIFVVFLLNCGYLATGQDYSDYCSWSLCSGLPHVGCGNGGQFGPQCPAGVREFDLAPYQNEILHRYNYYRNAVAGGYVPGYSRAVRMATMVWDDELEYLAYLNAIRCDFNHDDCRNTNRFRNSGQNIAWRWDPVNEAPSAGDAVLWAIDYWFSEYTLADMSVINSFYWGTGSEHFTVMVAERNVATGCAVLQYRDGGGMTTYVVCNYATTNIIDRPIYRSGRTTSQCREGGNPQYPNLCEVTEQYSVNSNRW